jgi:O-methyltransferase
MTEVITPVFMLVNKDYSQMLKNDTDAQKFHSCIMYMAKLMQDGEVPFTVHDDMFVWFRSMFWMQDPKFVGAMREFESDLVLRARSWRIYNLCWALSQAAHVDGDVVDVGCYEAKSTRVFCNYNKDLMMDKNLYLFDYFDAPDGDHKKANHGKQLANKVKKLMQDFCPVVCEGDVIETIPKHLPDEICFAHIDLNGHKAEAHVMPEIYKRLAKGGMILFDDYGFARYKESGLTHQQFLQGKPENILELPSGQGLMIKLSE